jgi:serine/threonine protein kinase
MYLIQELECLKRLRHPHVTQLMGVGIDTDENIFIVLELFELGTLRDYLNTYKHQIPFHLKL